MTTRPSIARRVAAVAAVVAIALAAGALGWWRLGRRPSPAAPPLAPVVASTDQTRRHVVAGPPPTLRVTRDDAGAHAVETDEAAFRAFCLTHGLPDPPSPDAIDHVAYRMIHEAVVATAAEPSSANLARLGMIYDGNALNAAAIACYEKAVGLTPDRHRWWHLLGRAHARAGRTGAAVAAFRRALEIEPDNAPALARLAELLLEDGDLAGAETALERYVVLRAGDPTGPYGLGRIAAERAEWETARDLLKRTLQINPRNQPALYLLARVHRELGDGPAAEACLRAATALPSRTRPPLRDPIQTDMLARSRSAGYLDGLKEAYVQAGRLREAYDTAMELLERRPDDVQNRHDLVELARRDGRPDDALEHALTLTRVQPRNPAGYLAAIELLTGRQRWHEALDLCDRAGANGIEKVNEFTRARLLRSAGRLREALAVADVGLARAPSSLEGHTVRARCLLDLDENAAARAALEHVLELDPGNRWATKAIEGLDQAPPDGS